MLPEITLEMSIPTGWLLLVLLALCMAEATLLLGSVVPGELAVALTASMVDTRYLPLTILAAAVGSMAGQGVGYLLGRLSGTGVRTNWVGTRIPARYWTRAGYVASTARLSTMIAVRFVAVAHTVAPVAAGVLGMPARSFGALAICSSLVWAAVWSTIGLIAGKAGRTINSELLAVVLVGLGMLVAGVTLNRTLREAVDDDGGQSGRSGVSRETPPAGRGST